MSKKAEHVPEIRWRVKLWTRDKLEVLKSVGRTEKQVRFQDEDAIKYKQQRVQVMTPREWDALGRDKADAVRNRMAEITANIGLWMEKVEEMRANFKRTEAMLNQIEAEEILNG